ncbi:sugar ABC transporter ATP-binding protein [Paenarthrobacter sp. NPDC057981]|uniref:sugar ABC transporter ATP-binding protein n=1 Tax=Paenarthrobacter sp. NPDC057981 TaxID=3346297 RepID=UPI0036D88B9E
MQRERDATIDIRGLVKSFGPTRALRGVDLLVSRGECHALLGRNGAGKSTLIAILTGLEKADEGSIQISGGEEVESAPDQELIACVYQKSTLVPDLTVAENITLGAYPRTKFGLVDWKQINSKALELLEEWGHGALAERLVADLEPIERKIVEVCRALSRGPRILLLDEPTAGLDGGGVEELFHQIRKLKSSGVTIIYVSHHLEEIFEICDHVTILRDGSDVLSKPVPDMTMDELIQTMTGSQGTPKTERQAETPYELTGDIQLAIEDLHVTDRVRGFNVQIQAGECIGLTGLDGAGHVQIGQAIAGQLTPSKGKIVHRSTELPAGHALAAIKAGIGFVPEDRHVNGYVPEMSIEENATLTILHRIRNRFGLVDEKSRRTTFEKLSSTWSIVCSGPTQNVEELSGGNQQKVVLARALASDPDTVVVINPTAGVDIAAKESIYQTLAGLTRQGKSVIVISSDDDDLRICDRVFAMYKGRQAAEFKRGFAEDELIKSVQSGESASSTNSPEIQE